MTINEAAGVNAFHIDKKAGKEISHEEFYRRVIDFLGGLNEVKKFIPFPLEILKEKYKKDPNLPTHHPHHPMLLRRCSNRENFIVKQ